MWPFLMTLIHLVTLYRNPQESHCTVWLASKASFFCQSEMSTSMGVRAPEGGIRSSGKKSVDANVYKLFLILINTLTLHCRTFMPMFALRQSGCGRWQLAKLRGKCLKVWNQAQVCYSNHVLFLSLRQYLKNIYSICPYRIMS